MSGPWGLVSMVICAAFGYLGAAVCGWWALIFCVPVAALLAVMAAQADEYRR